VPQPAKSDVSISAPRSIAARRVQNRRSRAANAQQPTRILKDDTAARKITDASGSIATATAFLFDAIILGKSRGLTVW
jgi:hypothetical protein